MVLSHALRTLGVCDRTTLVAMLQVDLQSVIEVLNDDAMLLAAQARAEVVLAEAARKSDAALTAARMDAWSHAVAAMEVKAVVKQCVSSAIEQVILRATRRDVGCTATFSSYPPFPRMVSAATQRSVAMKSRSRGASECTHYDGGCKHKLLLGGRGGPGARQRANRGGRTGNGQCTETDDDVAAAAELLAAESRAAAALGRVAQLEAELKAEREAVEWILGLSQRGRGRRGRGALHPATPPLAPALVAPLAHDSSSEDGDYVSPFHQC